MPEACTVPADSDQETPAAAASLEQVGDVLLDFGEESMRVSSVLLRLASPVFNRMLESGMKEAQQSVIKLVDFMKDACIKMLDHLPVTGNRLLQAQKCGLKRQRERCLHELARQGKELDLVLLHRANPDLLPLSGTEEAFKLFACLLQSAWPRFQSDPPKDEAPEPH